MLKSTTNNIRPFIEYEIEFLDGLDEDNLNMNLIVTMHSGDGMVFFGVKKDFIYNVSINNETIYYMDRYII